MSARAATAGAEAQRDAAPAGTDWKWTVARAMLMYFGVQFVMGPNGPFSSKKPAQHPPAVGQEPGLSANPDGPPIPPHSAVGVPPVSSEGQAVPPSSVGKPTIPVWPQDALLDFYVYISSAPAPTHQDLLTQYSDLIPGGGLQNAPEVPYSSFQDLLRDSFTPDAGSDARVVYANEARTNAHGLRPLAAAKWSAIRLGDFAMTRDADFVLKLDEDVRRNNGSIWADFVVAPRDVLPNPSDGALANRVVLRTRKLLTRLMPLKRKREEKNLFGGKADPDGKVAEGSTEESDDNGKAMPIVGYWHNNLTVALVQDDNNPQIALNQLPPPLLQYVHLPRDEYGDKLHDATGRFGVRFPTLFPNDFWLLKGHMSPVNETVTELPLHVNLYHQSWFKFQMLASVSEAFDKQSAAGGSGAATGSEIDMLKTMLLETNPWFLALTVTVSLLHSLFEFLAFSSDVRHWKDKDNLAGVSLGSILTNVVVQLIITLYLLDNNEETSWMILAGQAVGVLIEMWKLTKAVSVGIVAAPPGSLIPYRIKVSDKHVLSEEERKTQEYDKLAFKYVGWVAAPVLVAYTIYSALYQTHRGWWSFIISTATSFVYAFGFVSLVPQLIVNYKLKSTAGMNTKTFVYKILGTFVDDLFAFCIKMPTLHRLACFRDDIVFFIFLYQRWIYGVDPTRRNEFGQQLEGESSSSTHGSEKEIEGKDAGGKGSSIDAATTASTATAKASGIDGDKGTLRARGKGGK